MKLSGSLPVFFAAFGLALNLGAATDYTRRNEAFAPSVSRPATAASIQEKRANLSTPAIEQPSSALGDRRTPITGGETRAKRNTVPDRQQLRPASRLLDLSPLKWPLARISPAEDTRKPVLVAKYQDRMSAANTVTVGRTPVLDRGGLARLNRFVFRHHPPESLPTPAGAVSSRGAAPSKEP